MGLDEDIQSSRWRSERQKAAVNLMYTHNWLQERLREYFDQYGLTPQQYNILRILRGAGKPISTLQIRERMIDRASDTSRIVDRMIKKGLVQKSTCPNDKRLVDVTLSELGVSTLARMDETAEDIDRSMYGLNESEAQLLNSFLDRIRAGKNL